MAKIIIIAAIGKNLELGKNNELIWHFKEDMKFFKENTINHKIVMGYNTFKSLPSMLKNREHIILTTKDINIDNAKVFHDFPTLQKYLHELDEDVYIIGGASIYKLFIEYADILMLTEIDAKCIDASVYFPKFNKENYEVELLKQNEENGIKYNFMKYRRVK